MFHPVFLIIFAIVLFVIYQKIQNESPSKRRAMAIKYLIYGTIALLLLAVVTGRIHWLGAVIAGAVGLLKVGASAAMRAWPLLKFIRNSPINDPVFKTNYLEIKIQLKTGQMNGKVISGQFAGSPLQDLSSSQLDELESFLLSNDKRSYYLLRVARQRMGGAYDSSSSQGNGHSDVSVDSPSLDQARLILGLPEKYTKKDIEVAYKRLMQKLHPDRGGNAYLASRINVARDLLTKHHST